VDDLGQGDVDRLTDIMKLARGTRSIVEDLVSDEEE
jgi:hypothetical protein